MIREIGLQKFLAPAALGDSLYLSLESSAGTFFSYTTLINILDSSYYIGFIAIGVTFVIITGGIDLSVRNGYDVLPPLSAERPTRPGAGPCGSPLC